LIGVGSEFPRAKTTTTTTTNWTSRESLWLFRCHPAGKLDCVVSVVVFHSLLDPSNSSLVRPPLQPTASKAGKCGGGWRFVGRYRWRWSAVRSVEWLLSPSTPPPGGTISRSRAKTVSLSEAALLSLAHDPPAWPRRLIAVIVRSQNREFTARMSL